MHSIEEEKTSEINFLHPIGYFEPNCDKGFPNIYQYSTKEWVYEKCKICRKIFSAASIKSDLKTPSMINMGHKGCQGTRCQINRFNSVNLWNNSWRAMVLFTDITTCGFSVYMYPHPCPLIATALTGQHLFRGHGRSTASKNVTPGLTFDLEAFCYL